MARKRRDRTGEHAILPDDVPYLRDFLKAYDAHGNRVVFKGSKPREIEAPFEKRADVSESHRRRCHRGTVGELAANDAEMGTPNPNVPAQLEAIDCPGLGSKRSVDTMMTKEFLPHLDGALIFLKADQLRSKDVVEILEILKVNFGKLEGRVWIVVNKFDGLTREPLYGDADGRTVFDLIHQFMQRLPNPPEQIVFTSKKVYELAVECRRQGAAGTGRRPARRAARPIRFRPNVRATAFTAAFQHLLEDGGISYLRKLILETISEAVPVKSRQAPSDELKQFERRIDAHRLETEQRRVKGGRQQRDQAIQCHDMIQELLMELGTRTEFFRPLAEHLRKSSTSGSLRMRRVFASL